MPPPSNGAGTPRLGCAFLSPGLLLPLDYIYLSLSLSTDARASLRSSAHTAARRASLALFLHTEPEPNEAASPRVRGRHRESVRLFYRVPTIDSCWLLLLLLPLILLLRAPRRYYKCVQRFNVPLSFPPFLFIIIIDFFTSTFQE